MKFSNILIISTITIVVVGFLVWQLGTKEEVLAPSSKIETASTSTLPTTTDETAGWKTYTNKEYGFQFKYPKDNKTQEISAGNPTGLYISLGKGDIRIQEIDLSEDCMFNSKILEEKNMLSFITTKKINGAVFYYYKNYPNYLNGYCGMSAGCWYKDIYRTLHNNKCYQIIYNRSDRSFIEGNPYNNPKVIGDVKEIPEVFDQMLSTFKFIQ